MGETTAKLLKKWNFYMEIP